MKAKILRITLILILFIVVSAFQNYTSVKGQALLSKKVKWEGFCYLQQRHSYLEPDARATFSNQLSITPEMEDIILTENGTLIGYSPLLNGRYVREDREFFEQYSNLNPDVRLKALRKVNGELNVSPNQIVHSGTVQSNPVVIAKVTGSNEFQIKENLDALKLHLSDYYLRIFNDLDIAQYKYELDMYLI